MNQHADNLLNIVFVRKLAGELLADRKVSKPGSSVFPTFAKGFGDQPLAEASVARPTPILISGTPKNYSGIREYFWSRPEKKGR